MFIAPFLGFYAIGAVLQANLDYLVKLGILVVCYLLAHVAGKVLFDDRLMNVLPMAVYLATKVMLSLLR